MDSRGIIFSIDAALALIPLFILLAAVTNFGGTYIIFPDHIRIEHNAQDALETMASYKSEGCEFTVLQNITDILKRNNNSAEAVALSGNVAGSYLNKTLVNSKYTLTEISQLNGAIIASNADMEDACNIAMGIRNYGNYTFKLYIWD